MTNIDYKKYIFLATFILVIFSGLFYFLFNDGKFSSSNIVNPFSVLKLPFTGFATGGSDEIDLPKGEAEIAFEQNALDDAGINLTTEKLKEIKGVSKNSVAVKTEDNGENTLWIFDLDKRKKIEIGFNESAPASFFQIGIKDEFIFWLSSDTKKVFVFNSKTKEISSIDISNYGIGSRAQIPIPGSSWRLVLGAQEFYFYREDTGEVFSDDEGTVRNTFGNAENLGSFLDNDSLSGLKLEVQ